MIFLLRLLLLLASSLGLLFAVGSSGAAGCGGSSGGGGSSDTCQSYTATATCSDSWVELSPNGTAPEKRFAMGAGYDATNDILILFGGTNRTDYFNDVFTLANASGQGTSAWTDLSPTGTVPAARAYQAAGYRGASNKLILFGGSDASSIKMDLWILSNANGQGGTPAWTNPTVSGTAPSSRASMAFAYDATNDILILFGGRSCSSTTCTLFNDLFLITAVTTAPTWQQLSPSGTPPAKRAYASAVYDATNNRFILFGGTTSTSPSSVAASSQNDTWILSNANGTGGTAAWSELSFTTKPDKRSGQGAVYDVTNDRMILFGGFNTSNDVIDEVWILLDSAGSSPLWTQLITCEPIPSDRRFLVAAYTGAAANRMIVMGGEIGGGESENDVWVLTNANGKPGGTVASVSVTTETTELCTNFAIQFVPGASNSSGSAITDFLYYCTSSNTSVATVDSDCTVTAVAAGTVTITVFVEGVTKEVTLTIVESEESGSDDTGGEETWTGTFELQDVFHGAFDCTYVTTGSITMAITDTDGTLSGTSTFSNLAETVDPSNCPPNIHSATGSLAGTVNSSGNYAFTFFDLDNAGIAPFTATISGSSFSASGTFTSTGLVADNDYTYTITATKQ